MKNTLVLVYTILAPVVHVAPAASAGSSGHLAFVLPNRPRVAQPAALTFVLPNRPRVSAEVAFVLPNRPRASAGVAAA